MNAKIERYKLYKTAVFCVTKLDIVAGEIVGIAFSFLDRQGEPMWDVTTQDGRTEYSVPHIYLTGFVL